MSNKNNEESTGSQGGILPGMTEAQKQVGGTSEEPGQKVGHTHGTSNQPLARGGTDTNESTGQHNIDRGHLVSGGGQSTSGAS